MRTNENLCLIRALGDHLLLQKLRFYDEIRSADKLEAKGVTVTKKELDMALALIKEYSNAFDISKYKDKYNAALLKIIKAKASGKRPTIKKLKITKTKSEDLFEQLKESLNTTKKRKTAS
jgi:DNA end-binding protein Ku